MIQRAISRSELRCGADGFGDKYFGARDGIGERRSLGELRRDGGRVSASAAMRMTGLYARSGEFATTTVTEIQNIDGVAAQMPAFHEDIGRAQLQQLFAGAIHRSAILHREARQHCGFVEIRS
jgi:hypothetical protein